MPGNAYGVKNKRVNQIKSTGRGQAITPQALVVLNCSFASDQENRDRNEKDTVAPYSEDKAVYVAAKGEWAMGRVNGCFVRGARQTIELQNAVQAFTSVNGLRRSDRVMALGIVDNPSMNHSGDDLLDSYGVVRIAGSCTGINTGPETIPAMSHVYLVPEPYTVSNEQGDPIPGIDMTALEVPGGKFLPQTIALSSGSTTCQMNWLKIKLRKLLGERDSFLTDLEAQKIVRSKIRESHIHTEMPLHTWAELWFALELIERSRYEPNSHELETIAIPYTIRVLNECFNKNDSWKQKYLRSLGDELLPKVAPRLSWEPLSVQGVRSPYEPFFKEVMPKLHDALIKTQALQHDFLETHYLGLCTTNSPPGRPMDVILRVSRG